MTAPGMSVQLLGIRMATWPMATVSRVAACSFSFPAVIHSLMPSMMSWFSSVDGVSGEMATTMLLYRRFSTVMSAFARNAATAVTTTNAARAPLLLAITYTVRAQSGY